MPRPYKSAIKSELQKEIDIEVGKKLKQVRNNRVSLVNKNGDPTLPQHYFEKKNPCTQTELSKVLDCTFQQIQKFEHGKNTLSLYKMFLVSKFFNISIEEFTNIYKAKLYPLAKSSWHNDLKTLHTKLIGQYEPPINSSNKDRDCSLSQEL